MTGIMLTPHHVAQRTNVKVINTARYTLIIILVEGDGLIAPIAHPVCAPPRYVVMVYIMRDKMADLYWRFPVHENPKAPEFFQHIIGLTSLKYGWCFGRHFGPQCRFFIFR